MRVICQHSPLPYACPMKILFLAANPEGTSELQLRTELNRIDSSLQKGDVAHKFELVHRWAVDATVLRRVLLDEKPDIVHFSGHGTGAEGLMLVGQDGKPKPATGDALAELFGIVNDEIKRVRCVLLNACYAEEQARAIFQRIDNVIGMRKEVKDDAAIAFATGFYDGLGRDLSISTSFRLGRVAIQFELASFSQATRQAIVALDEAKEILQKIPEYLKPVLFSREADASNFYSESFAEALKEDGLDKEEALKLYQEDVQKFLTSGKLTKTETFQLSTRLTALGLTEEEASRILEEEQRLLSYESESLKQFRAWVRQALLNHKSLLWGRISIEEKAKELNLPLEKVEKIFEDEKKRVIVF